MLNLLMVTPRYFPCIGGTETHVYEVSRRLVHYGISVTVLTTMPPSTTLPAEEVVEGVRIIRVKAWLPESDYYLAPAISAIVEQGGWDLVHCQGCHTFVPVLAMLAAARASIPYLISLHTGGHSSRLRTGLRDVQWRLQRPLLARAVKLIGVSQFEADYFRRLLSLPPHKVAVIPNGITSAPLPGEAHSRDEHLIISPGRLQRYKGHQHMIAALPHIRTQCHNARLLILGAGPYESHLRRLAAHLGIAEHVEIRAVPAAQRQEMAALLSRAALVTLLSEYEAHPVAILEALALGRPALVADTSGLRELAQQGLVRAIPPHSTPAQIAATVLQQLDEPHMPSRIALPDWDECAARLYATYMTAAGRELCVS